jgi:hypothetical protein
MKKYLLLLLGVLFLSGCSKSDTKTTYTYAGPGSDYSVEFEGDTSGNFTLTESVADTTVKGTWETAETGFKKLTVDSSTDETIITKNAVRYGVDIPGFTFMMQPLNSDDKKALVTVATGNCPSTDFSGNFILTNIANGEDAKTAFTNGVLSYTNATNKVVLDSVLNITGGVVVGGPEITLADDCKNGKETFTATSNGGNGTIYYTQDGAAVVQFLDGTIAFVLPKHNIAEEKEIDGAYHGLVLVDGDVEPFKFTIKEETGNSTFNRLDSTTLETLVGSMNEGTSNITELGIGTGLHRGSYSMTHDEVPGGKAGANMSCMSGKVNSRGYFVCVGSDAGVLFPPFDLLNVLMVTK